MVRGMNDTSFDTASSYFRALTDLRITRLVWELCLDDDLHSACSLDDSWSWVLLFRSCEEKVRPFAYMAVDDVDGCC